eukprot:TRINITY_DN78824_c0_g1_i1.p1 TRINITY_DN78824_c0_g1~~TRINITY_DN78824_c0_g1_i1.p1  ORF type:complete len:109 (-),score=17.71 TRINITY_DN78824_c0_g1_i1:11-337(-)
MDDDPRAADRQPCQSDPSLGGQPPAPVGKFESDDFRQLSTDLPLSLLRGVPRSEALAGYGQHFRGLSSEQDLFPLSTPTSVIADFLSHDWRARLPEVTKWFRPRPRTC